MKTKTAILLIAALFLTGLLTGRFLLPSGDAPPAPAPSHEDEQASTASDTTWTCSMHPQIQQDEPGDCPICGMDLIPITSEDEGDTGPRILRMSEASRALAEIQTTPVKREYPEASVRLVGKLAYDETRVKSLTARFPARIDTLYVNYTGIQVEKGEHLAEVYSPELLTAQREFLAAHRANPGGDIARAAREKLRLWDLLPEQIDAILERGEALDHFTLKAPIGGVVVSKHVKEGDYVKTGESLFKIVDLEKLWLMLDAYESDLTWLRYGQEVDFTVEAFPGETFHGRIAFIEPEVNQKTRTVPVRVNVPNPDRRLKPGMFAKGVAHPRLAADGKLYAPKFAGKWISPMHPEIVKDHPGQCDVCGMDLVPAETLGYVENPRAEAPLVVPTSAVLRTGKRSVVYVEDPNAERPTYEGREIVIGPRAGDVLLVESGLGEGERVVTNGAFKIDSSLQIQAKPSMMNPQGGGPAPGHQHGSSGDMEGMDMEGMDGAELMIPPERAAELLPTYLDLREALAVDDLDAAKSKTRALMETTGHSGALPALLHDMLAAETLDDLRIPHFKLLSTAMINALENAPGSLEEPVRVMHCPMAAENAGADWLQRTDPLSNPYFGAAMRTCGEVVRTIGIPVGQDGTKPEQNR